MAVLLAFLTRDIHDAGIGWKLHNDNLGRVQSYFRQHGFDRAWKLADHCFHEGEDGGAALWDWSLAQAGFLRASLLQRKQKALKMFYSTLSRTTRRNNRPMSCAVALSGRSH